MSVVDLSDVQGNILKGFDKPNIRLIFFKFGNEVEKTKEWLGSVSKKIQSTTDLIRAAEELKRRRQNDPQYYPQEIFLHASLSKSGLDVLHLKPPPSAGTYIVNEGNKKVIKVEAGLNHPFEQGMEKGDLGDTGDSAPENWIEPFKSSKIDVLFIVASDEEDDGDSYAVRLIEEASLSGLVCVGVQIGKALENESGKQIEHFGFRDGISQPLIEGIDDDEIEKRKINKDKFEPEEFVLFGLPGDLAWANNGSFLVLRRLRQDVTGFWEFVKMESEKHLMRPDALAAKFFGRWKSGAPLNVNNSQEDPIFVEDSKLNDFVYMKNDPRGEQVPRFSHIRKSNPRDDGKLTTNERNFAENRRHRMLRRGIPYGIPWGKDPTAERGLLFLCYQRDILQQFEYVQSLWANKSDFPLPEYIKTSALNMVPKYHGPDPISGQHHGEESANLLHRGKFEEVTLKQFVTTTGGGYFFSPSISALKKLQLLVFLRDSRPYGKSFEAWTEKWLRWLLGIPKPSNPAVDDTGKHCAKNQIDPNFWFLAGTTGGSAYRKCNITKARAILCPIIVDEQSVAEKPSLLLDSDLETVVKNETDNVTDIRATVDDVEIPNLKKYRVRTRPFDVILPKENIWGVRDGLTRAAADGYWLFLKPLDVGEHIIKIVGKGPHFENEVTYDLEVKRN